MKRLIAVLAVALFAFPAAAVAASDLRAPDQRTPHVVIAPRLPALGTDVAAPYQRSPIGGSATKSAPASSGSDFDWGAAGIGAGCAICLVAISLGSSVAVHRRRVRRMSMVAG